MSFDPFNFLADFDSECQDQEKPLSIATDCSREPAIPLDGGFGSLIDLPEIDLPNFPEMDLFPDFTTCTALSPGLPSPNAPEPLVQPVRFPENTQPVDYATDENQFSNVDHHDEHRLWHTIFSNANILKGDITVKSKTRLDNPCSSLPDRLYASLKYEIIQSATGVDPSLQFILAKAQVCEAESGQVVDSVKNVPSLKGTVEAALTKSTEEENSDTEPVHLNGTLKLQFGNKLSYHSTKKHYYLEIHYFLPENLSSPIYIKRSASFKVFARKPNIDPKKREKIKPKKRKREDGNPGPRKVARVETSSLPSSSSLADFKNRLEDLVQVNSQLSAEEKKHAMDLVVSKFLSLDPSLAGNLFGTFGSS